MVDLLHIVGNALCLIEELLGALDRGLQLLQQRRETMAQLPPPWPVDVADELKKGNLEVLAFPDFFPNQGGLPIKVDGETIGAIAVSGAASEVDEAIGQVALDALLKK